MKSIIYVLIGPKGAGKTHIGTRIAENSDVCFLRVEPIWLSLSEGEDGWDKVASTIDDLARSHSRIMIESLGAGPGFAGLKERLEENYDVRLIRVQTDLGECLKRVRERDSTDHIPISDEKVEEYNAIAARVVYDWDAVIDNNGPATLQEMLEAIED